MKKSFNSFQKEMSTQCLWIKLPDNLSQFQIRFFGVGSYSGRHQENLKQSAPSSGCVGQSLGMARTEWKPRLQFCELSVHARQVILLFSEKASLNLKLYSLTE